MMEPPKYELRKLSPERIAYEMKRLGRHAKPHGKWTYEFMVEDVGSWTFGADTTHERLTIYTTLLVYKEWVESYGYRASLGLQADSEGRGSSRIDEGRSQGGPAILRNADSY